MSDATQWVSVLERMPRQRSKDYLTLNEEGHIRVNWYSGFADWRDDKEGERILMWCELPQEPHWEQVVQPILDELDRRDEAEEDEDYDDNSDDDFEDEEDEDDE